jgi:glycosyltransferase involved in cell wall biosynthesis
VTGEIARHELSRLPAGTRRATLIYPNGVLYPADGESALDERTTDTVEIVFVASAFFAWHGLDRLLRSLDASRVPVTLHLVGAVPPAFLAATRRDSRIRVHGVLAPSQLDAILAKSWVGLSSFALDRKRMQEACTLKVREYLRAGLPVYAGHRDAALPPDFPFCREGSADIEAIVAFARQTRTTSRAAVAAAARPFIDKQILLQRLHAALLAEARHAVGVGTS